MGMHTEWANASAVGIDWVPVDDEDFSDDHGNVFDRGDGGILLSSGADGGMAIEGTYDECEEFARRILRAVERARNDASG